MNGFIHVISANINISGDQTTNVDLTEQISMCDDINVLLFMATRTAGSLTVRPAISLDGGSSWSQGLPDGYDSSTAAQSLTITTAGAVLIMAWPQVFAQIKTANTFFDDGGLRLGVQEICAGGANMTGVKTAIFGKYRNQYR